LSVVSLVALNAMSVACLWLVQTDRMRQASHLDRTAHEAGER